MRIPSYADSFGSALVHPASSHRSRTGHINISISHSGSKAQHEGDTRNHVLQDPYVSILYYTILYNTILYCTMLSYCIL